ncbi:MAG: Dabb family protein [Planctomycetaceae bacterium]
MMSPTLSTLVRDALPPFASLAVLLASVALVVNPAVAADAKLKKGDRIVFLGDSITQAGERPGGYIRVVREFLETRHAQLELKVIGAGISGHKVPDLEKRLDRDVLAHKPQVVVIYIGINDVWHSLQKKGTSKPDFEAGLGRLITRIEKAGARVILCTPSVIGEKPDGSNRLDKMLAEYAAISRGVAARTGVQLLDLNREFLDYLRRHNPLAAGSKVLTTDGVHLNDAGNRFVAARMLEALGVSGTGSRRLRHVVMFKFKPGVNGKQVQEVVRAFAALPQKIEAIVGFEHGIDVSVENKHKGLTHGFVVTFRDEKGRDAYLPHPAHQEFVKLVGPRVDDVLVFDYWTGQ